MPRQENDIEMCWICEEAPARISIGKMTCSDVCEAKLEQEEEIALANGELELESGENEYDILGDS